MLKKIKQCWDSFANKHQTLAQFLVFFVLSNGITVLQIAMMPFFKWIFGMTALVDTNFQLGHIGSNFDGT
ncbi:MAG TPA: hypothetical protein PLM59_00825, partial [Oscillospiraceae bacterium]|nr:hypothetical protein [Oscillospiraceae bacterium]